MRRGEHLATFGGFVLAAGGVFVLVAWCLGTILVVAAPQSAVDAFFTPFYLMIVVMSAGLGIALLALGMVAAGAKRSHRALVLGSMVAGGAWLLLPEGARLQLETLPVLVAATVGLVTGLAAWILALGPMGLRR